MNRRLPISLLGWIVLLAAAAHAPAPVAANTGSTQCVAATTVVVQQAAWLRAGPGTTHATSGTVAPQTVLSVVTYQQGGSGCWYQVDRNGLLVWIAGSTVVPTAPTDTPAPPQPSPSTLSSPTAAPPRGGAPAGDPSTTGADTLPASGTDALEPAESPTRSQQRHIVVRVCLDTNANQFCDVGDGIGGMPVFALDGATGSVLAWGRTDTDGVLPFVVRTAPDAAVTINIPYLGTFDTVARDGQAVTRTVPFTPALPGLIP